VKGLPAYHFDYGDKIKDRFGRMNKSVRRILLVLFIAAIIIIPFWAKIQALLQMRKIQQDVVSASSDAEVQVLDQR